MKTAILLLCALASNAAAATFFVHLEVTPAVDFAHLTPEQMAILQQHGISLQKARDSGVLIAAGRMLQDPKHAHAMAIVNAESEAAAKEMIAADPAVKAGLMKFTVEPLELFFPAAPAK